jgi:hypothetical protein
VSPLKYELGFYTPDDGILHSHRRENLKAYIVLTGWTFHMKYDLGYYIPEDGILHSHRRVNLKSYMPLICWIL